MMLQGKTIVVTRPLGQEESLVTKLEKAGALVLACPLISIVRCFDPEELEKTLSNAADWIVFTSANGVHLTLKFAEEKQLLNRFKNAKIACIGKMTEAALSEYGFHAALIPESFRAEGLIDAFKKEGIKGRKFLLLRAKKAREVLRQALTDFGGEVTELAIYDTMENREGMERLRIALQEKPIDCISFTSPSTVHAFSEISDTHYLFLANTDAASASRLPGNCVFASIGPITSDALREAGFPVSIEAKTYTAEGLFEAISDFFKKKVIA